MGQAAYDMNAVRRRRAPQTRKNVPLRVEKGGKRRLTPFQAAMQHAIQLISVALLVGFAVSLLWSEAQLVELNDQIQDAKAAAGERAESVHLLQQCPEQQNEHHQRGRSGQPPWPHEDRPEPDHLHPAG